MAVDSTNKASVKSDRITRRLLIAIGVYSALFVGFLNLAILNSNDVKGRAIFLRADGMILLWIIVSGSLAPMLRRRLVPRIAAIPLDWRVRFVILCTAMALTEVTSHVGRSDAVGWRRLHGENCVPGR